MSRAVNERTQQRAMGEFYDNIKVENLHKIKICKTFVRVIYPVFCVIFVILFWMTGLVHYYQ